MQEDLLLKRRMLDLLEESDKRNNDRLDKITEHIESIALLPALLRKVFLAKASDVPATATICISLWQRQQCVYTYPRPPTCTYAHTSAFV